MSENNMNNLDTTNETTVYKAFEENQNTIESAPLEQPEVVIADDTKKKQRTKKKENAAKAIIRIIITIVIIILGIFLILWAVAKAAKYETIGNMLVHMWGELDLMWKRIAE